MCSNHTGVVDFILFFCFLFITGFFFLLPGSERICLLSVMFCFVLFRVDLRVSLVITFYLGDMEGKENYGVS